MRAVCGEAATIVSRPGAPAHHRLRGDDIASVRRWSSGQSRREASLQQPTPQEERQEQLPADQESRSNRIARRGISATLLRPDRLLCRDDLEKALLQPELVGADLLLSEARLYADIQSFRDCALLGFAGLEALLDGRTDIAGTCETPPRRAFHAIIEKLRQVGISGEDLLVLLLFGVFDVHLPLGASADHGSDEKNSQCQMAAPHVAIISSPSEPTARRHRVKICPIVPGPAMRDRRRIGRLGAGLGQASRSRKPDRRPSLLGQAALLTLEADLSRHWEPNFRATSVSCVLVYISELMPRA